MDGTYDGRIQKDHAYVVNAEDPLMVWRYFTWLLNPHLNRELNMSITAAKYESKIQAIHCLRVNVKSLAAETKIIRNEENRCGSEYRSWLVCHRKLRLRTEARISQLALAYVRGVPYRNVEHKARIKPSAKAIAAKIGRFMYIPGCEESVEHWLKQ